MAGPYASLTSPYAPGPGHMNDAFRIADLIGQQGQSAARAKLAKGLMIGDLVGDIGGTVGGIFAARDHAKTQQADAQKLADLLSSGQPVDLPTLIREIGPERAKELYPLLESELKKREAATEAKQQGEARQAFADSVLNNPASTPEQKAAVGLWMKTGGKVTPPTGLGPDPAVATAAAAQKKLDAKNALLAQAAEALKHGMSRVEAQQWYGAQTGGESLPKEWFPEDPPKPTNTPNPTEASLALLAAQGDAAAAKALALLRAQKADGGGGGGSGTGGLPKLTGAQQDDLATMDTVVDLSGLATALGDKIGWKGVGGLWTGTITGQAAKQLGWGSEDEEKLRNYLGNIQGTIAKLRGGTAFSVQEKAMLDSYTPGINDADTVIQSKLKSLGEFIQLKKANALKYAGGGGPPAPMPSHPPGGGIPDGVKRALANEPANPPPQTPYVLADGSKWRKNTDGSIQRVP